MALSAKVVNLIRLDFLNDFDQIAAICEIAVVENKPRVLFMGVLVKVIDPAGVETAGPAFDPVDVVSLGQKKLSQIAAVLSGNSGDQGDALMVLAHLI
jgi:hypothetical protein